VAKASLRQGQIVFAPLIPERGEVKLRPAVIYTPDAMLGDDEWVRVVAISTSCRPDDPHIPIPDDAATRLVTRLNRPSSIALSFVDKVYRTHIQPTRGRLPQELLIEMIVRLKLLSHYGTDWPDPT